MVMGGEQGAGLQLVMQVFRNGPRNGKAVKGGGSAPYFIQNDQGAFRGVVQNQGGLTHFHHEGGLPARQVVTGPHAAENAVHQADVGGLRRNVGPDLGHQRNQGHLADIGALARHVGPGQQNEAAFLRFQKSVIGHERVTGNILFNDGMAAVDNMQGHGIIQHGAAVPVLLRSLRQPQQHVQVSHGVRRNLHRGLQVIDHW